MDRKVQIRTIVKRNSGEKKLIAMINEPEHCLSTLSFKDEEFSIKQVFLPVNLEKFSIIFNNLIKAKAEFGSAFCRKCARENLSREKPLNCRGCQIKFGRLDIPPIDGIVLFVNKDRQKRKIIFFYLMQNEEYRRVS